MHTVKISHRRTRVMALVTIVAWMLAGSALAVSQTGTAAAQKPKAGAEVTKKPTTTGAPAQPAPQLPAARPPIGTTQEAGYAYRPEGRRDPFVSLVRVPGGSTDLQARRSEGLAGVLTQELTLKGILYSRGAYVALVQGPDTKTYIARQNDKVADGTIRAITADGLIILQEVNDPLSLTKQREVPKTLRALEGVK